MSLRRPAGAAKYGNVKTVAPGPTGAPRTYDSKAEAALGQLLNWRKAAGEIAAWVPQVSLECGIDDNGKAVRAVVDALVVLEIRENGTFVGRFQDKKGFDTEKGRAKRAALRSLYGLDVEIV